MTTRPSTPPSGTACAAGLIFTQQGKVARAKALNGEPLERIYGYAVRSSLTRLLTEGKKRQIRRMCELVGLKVVGLKRIRIGRVPLAGLLPRQWRYLLPNERF